MENQFQVQDPQKDFCPICGEEQESRKCRLFCENCGYLRDCSDP
jgi:hypothetical protein